MTRLLLFCFFMLGCYSVRAPLISGFLVQHLGFPAMFDSFASMAVLGAAWFLLLVPETRGATTEA